MHPRHYAQSHPDKPAILMAESGEFTTYGQLEKTANRGAQLLRSLGVKNGDIIAIWSVNAIEFLEIYWAAQRAGVYLCPIPVHLSIDDAAYILDNCKAKLAIFSSEIPATEQLTKKAATLVPGLENVFSIHGPIAGTKPWSESLADMPDHPIADEQAGFHLVYSSGTTGRAKGVKLPLIGGLVTADTMWADRYEKIFGLTQESVFLACAPLYHAAPILFSTNSMRRGALIVIMKKFKADETLKVIQKYKVTMCQMVPTMFIRMLRLPDAERASYDVSSMTHIIHAAAPCPPEVKYQMMDWFGDVIDEYYAGSESAGATTIDSADWRKKPGSVGRAIGCKLHICNEEGDQLPVGTKGLIYFSGGYDFEYLGDPVKTKNARNPKNSKWATLGDIGYVDNDGYLFLTGRKNFVIISGGVNIYPQESENLLIGHPKVADVAVIGVPNEDMGEEVKAVVQPIDWNDAGENLEAELIKYCQSNLSRFKCPRSIDFDKSLPRQDNGKLYKRLVRDRYWDKTKSS